MLVLETSNFVHILEKFLIILFITTSAFLFTNSLLLSLDILANTCARNLKLGTHLRYVN